MAATRFLAIHLNVEIQRHILEWGAWMMEEEQT